MRSKEIEDHKKDLALDSMQRSILVGTLLGDGHLETQDGGRTYRLKVEHSIKQKEYADWLYEQFQNLVRTKPEEKAKQLGEKTHASYGFSTYSLGTFRFYAQQFYEGKKKRIPKMLGKLLDPVALAVWFMDDGSFKSKHHATYIIHALGYTRSDLGIVQEVLQKKFGIMVSIHKQYQQFRIYFLSETAEKFKKLVEPYIVPSLKYKLGEHSA